MSDEFTEQELTEMSRGTLLNWLVLREKMVQPSQQFWTEAMRRLLEGELLAGDVVVLREKVAKLEAEVAYEKERGLNNAACHDEERAKLEAKVSELTAWRRELWLTHNPACSRSLYGDDGEMQCPRCLVDFRRDSPARVAEGLMAVERERCAKVVEAMSAAISGPEQDALQWYARSSLQRAAKAIRRGE